MASLQAVLRRGVAAAAGKTAIRVAMPAISVALMSAPLQSPLPTRPARVCMPSLFPATTTAAAFPTPLFQPARFFAAAAAPVAVAAPAAAAEPPAAADAAADADAPLSPAEVEAAIVAVLEERVAPTVRADGGDVHFVSFSPATGACVVRLSGACASCDRATLTLRMLVERALRFYVPEVKTVSREPEEEAAASARAAAEAAEGGYGVSDLSRAAARAENEANKSRQREGAR